MLCHMGSNIAYIALGPHSIGAGGYCIVATGTCELEPVYRISNWSCCCADPVNPVWVLSNSNRQKNPSQPLAVPVQTSNCLFSFLTVLIGQKAFSILLTLASKPMRTYDSQPMVPPLPVSILVVMEPLPESPKERD